DDTGEGVGTVDRRTGPADHLDAVDGLHRHATPHEVATTGEEVGLGNAVDQHQDLGVEGGVDPAHGVDGVVSLVAPRNVHPGDGLQHLVDIGGTEAADILRGDDAGHGGRLRQRLLVAGGDADQFLAAVDA